MRLSLLPGWAAESLEQVRLAKPGASTRQHRPGRKGEPDGGSPRFPMRGLIVVRLRGLLRASLERGLGFGDVTLQGMVRAARSETRSTDVIARWNSDEILVGIEDTDGTGEVARRLGAALASAVADDFRKAGVEIETGWACTRDGENVEAWLKSAYDRCTRVPL